MSSDETVYMEIQSGSETDASQVDASSDTEVDDQAEEYVILAPIPIDENGEIVVPINAVAIAEDDDTVEAIAEAVATISDHDEPMTGATAQAVPAAASGDDNVKYETKRSVSPRKASPNKSVDEDGQMCTICFEPWTSSSEHRLVSLRCGHLYGRSCISRWLKGQGSRCPQCNARARKSEIRPIFARTLRVLDTSERDRALKDLEKECELRRKSEFETAQMRLKYQMASHECERLKKELIDTQMLLQESRSTNKCIEKLSQSRKKNSSSFTLEKYIELSKHGGCRVMDCCDLLGMMVVSQQSTNPLFPGYGLKKISTPDMKLAEFLCIHQKPIKDVCFHSHDGLILTASQDRTVKLTNFLSNSIVQTYNLESDVWSCAWDTDDPCYFFAGVRNGLVYQFDIRVTGRYVYQLPALGSSAPVFSLQYLPRMHSAKYSKCGPIVGQLSNCYFYEKVDGSSSYVANPLPLEGLFTSLSCDPTTGHFLASCRPSVKHSRVTHTLCEISFETSSFSCNVVQSMHGGGTQVQLTRSKLFPHPDDDSSVLVCAGDEDSKAALIWNGSTGAQIDSLKADSPVLDLATFRANHQSRLATLTDKGLRVYSWARV